ncbi:MAG: PTS sugar transporter subunit IIA [Candidatus Nitronauta litoralis]|uniref:PTS sugar transporter subunit IIA n=1 Tax=Candidatus Nitronauta litoralis TaxID=2705533 RepID=A0A7T0BXT5_9BACT|nr:MAG: PTS sugar transporter subunit IIA [Candidatus Nitronauta litoralis]
MSTPEYHEIRAWCKESQEIADEYGIEEALSYLLGEKFAPLLRELKKARRQVQFLYSEKDRSMVEPLAKKDQDFRLGYMMTLENNYREQLEAIKHLERLTGDFMEEIRDAFEEQDVLEFLENYPRLDSPQDDLTMSFETLGGTDSDQFTTKDLMAEVEDIYLAEEIRKLLQNKWQAR